MADGYARASGRPAFVNLHVSAGLANGLSQIYNAREHHSPLLVSAGQAESDMLIEEPLLSADSVSLARPFTKWAWELRQATDLPIVLRRGLKVALTAPRGPVFVSLPIDLLERPSPGVDAPRAVNEARRSPVGELVAAAAEIIHQSANPVVLVSDDVGRAGATEQLIRLAECVGASVFALAQCEMSYPNDHELFVRTLNPSSSETRRHLSEADVIVAVGTPLFKQLLSPRVSMLRDGAQIVQIVDGDWEVDKNLVSDVALVGGLAISLEALHAALDVAMTRPDRVRAERRRSQAAEGKRQQASRLEARVRSAASSSQIDELHLAAVLRSVLPQNYTIVEEAPSASSALQQVFRFSQPRSLFGNQGAALGWAMPAALGVQLAMPDQLVVAVIGDGAANYSIQALWTAAHYKLPTKFVICNNRQYKILKTNLGVMFPDVNLKGVVGMDLTTPDIDFVALAAGYGVPGTRITSTELLGDGLAAAMRMPGPFVVDVLLGGSAPNG